MYKKEQKMTEEKLDNLVVYLCYSLIKIKQSFLFFFFHFFFSGRGKLPLLLLLLFKEFFRRTKTNPRIKCEELHSNSLDKKEKKKGTIKKIS